MGWERIGAGEAAGRGGCQVSWEKRNLGMWSGRATGCFFWGGGINAVRRLVLPGVRTCSPFEEGILHVWMGGGVDVYFSTPWGGGTHFSNSMRTPILMR